MVNFDQPVAADEDQVIEQHEGEEIPAHAVDNIKSFQRYAPISWSPSKRRGRHESVRLRCQNQAVIGAAS